MARSPLASHSIAQPRLAPSAPNGKSGAAGGGKSEPLARACRHEEGRTFQFRGEFGYRRVEVRIGGRDDDVRLPVRGLEGGELAVDERGRHEVIAAAGDPRTHQFAIRAQINEAQPASDAGAQPFAINAPQRRAGGDRRHATAAAVTKRRGDAIEPRPAILVGKRMSGRHFGAGGVGMEIVPVDEIGAERRGQSAADHSFARSPRRP